ncbi:MAG: hypothetical protein GC147_06200 [Porphyrobacter sp.]|nr:hypothetical protein [Porphyrobacter sp.]
MQFGHFPPTGEIGWESAAKASWTLPTASPGGEDRDIGHGRGTKDAIRIAAPDFSPCLMAEVVPERR